MTVQNDEFIQRSRSTATFDSGKNEPFGHALDVSPISWVSR